MLSEAITSTVASGLAVLLAAHRLHQNPNDLPGLLLGYVAGMGLFVAVLSWRGVIACWKDDLIDWWRKKRGLPPRIPPIAFTLSSLFDRCLLDAIKNGVRIRR